MKIIVSRIITQYASIGIVLLGGGAPFAVAFTSINTNTLWNGESQVGFHKSSSSSLQVIHSLDEYVDSLTTPPNNNHNNNNELIEIHAPAVTNTNNNNNNNKNNNEKEEVDKISRCVDQLDQLGWLKIFLDTRTILPKVFSLTTTPVWQQQQQQPATFTSRELRNHFSRYGTLLPIAHPLNMANSRTDWYRKLTKLGQPIMDDLAELLVLDMMELSELKL